jgi:hypothetical protein
MQHSRRSLRAGFSRTVTVTSPRPSSPAAMSVKGHWCRFHRFFSHAAWNLDTLSMHLAKLIVTILSLGATHSWAVDDTLCRKRGLTLYGAGMHHDPLISSRSKRLVSWGHDWVVLCLIIDKPFWAPTKVFGREMVSPGKRCQEPFSGFFGRPRGCMVDSKPSRATVRSIQASSPNGEPRAALRCSACNSASVCGAFT